MRYRALRTGKSNKGTFVDLITINGHDYVQTGNRDLENAITGALIRHSMIWRDDESYEIRAETIQIATTIKDFKLSVGDPGKITRGNCGGCGNSHAPFPEQGDYLCIRCRDAD